ncbi:MAG: TonB-dependent receptor [Gammaproteobacteria bacterium]|nr:TonB-dependent receptor [Pseudomonadales bacterium]MCP5349144.1 TonB-dependent receptor [Pseudomonadales bacterium]
MPTTFRKSRLARAISYGSIPVLGLMAHQAIGQQPLFETIIVTGSRREADVQEIPLNISAVGGEDIQDLRLDGIDKISFYVPGLTVVDRGPRNPVPDVLVRGLNTAQLGPGFDASTVATYFGELPLTLDVNPVDLERVEVLIGPQGTLYGQGTMGGAIRYIPRVASTSDGFTVDLRGNSYLNREADDFGFDYGLTLNIPLLEDSLAVRINADRRDDPGFIDYNYVVREGGVSNPEPDLSDPSEVNANLRRVEDANSEETDSLRVNLHWTPVDWLDANFWYYKQETNAGGRQLNHRVAFDSGRYESAYRYLEPFDYTNKLLSFDAKVDLGFAEATLVYGDAEYEELGQRDQTDLLLDFEYGYEFFPSFSAFTREVADQDAQTTEIRLVSTYDGPVSWVLGYFNDDAHRRTTSEEFTPGFDQWAYDNWGTEGLRPDSLEYVEMFDQNIEETAYYAEVTYAFTDDFSATIGYRNYEFDTDVQGGFGLPLADTIYGGAPADYCSVEAAGGPLAFAAQVFAGDPQCVGVGENSGTDSGDLFKFNLAWNFSLDGLVYFTYSQGYRNGGLNAVPECTPEQINSGEQELCALPEEVFIDPDTIDNYEIGYKGLITDNISAAAALYYIDWQDLQVATTTEFGSLPITGNGSEAESRGLELQGQWIINSNWSTSLTYAYTDAKLTARAPGLIGPYDVLSGARLPGHARHQGSANINYDTQVFDGWDLTVNYGLVFSSDVYNIAGGGDDPLVDAAFNDEPGDWGGEAIPGYDVYHLSATLRRDAWTLQAYVDNLFDRYYVTGTRGTRRFLANESTGPGRDVAGFTLRNYGQYVGAPRTIGLRARYQF